MRKIMFNATVLDWTHTSQSIYDTYYYSPRLLL